jgi:hypothetical protein
VANVLADTRLVAQRPDDDGRVVLVPLDEALRAVDKVLGPVVRVGGVLAPVAETKAVGLESVFVVGLEAYLKVALVDYPETVLVAEIKKVGVRGIVASPDGVDIVLLHEEDILEHRLVIQSTAKFGVELVAVDSLEEDSLAVDLDNAVECDGAEADTKRHALTADARVEETVVQARNLGSPRLDGDSDLGARGSVDS